MRKSMRHQQLRDWWEFQTLYRHLSGFPSSSFSDHHPRNSTHFSDTATSSLITSIKQHNTHTATDNQPATHDKPNENKINDNNTTLPLLNPTHPDSTNHPHYLNHTTQQTKATTSTHNSTSDYSNVMDIKQNNRSINSSGNSHKNSHINQQSLSQQSNHSKVKSHQPKMSSSRQNQSKRQREWIYLSHYLTISGLNPIYVISGSDDGREPDFTLVFYHDYRLYYVGVELTTLPRLRDRMGDENLIAKRWYWQSLHQMARLREKEREGHSTENLIQSYDRFRLPLQTLYMPKTEFANMPNATSMITQQDVDEVMGKKAHKVDAYHTRRPLQELWLLVHTDKYQSQFILTAPDYQLMHESGFDQVHITRYPSHKVISVNKK